MLDLTLVVQYFEFFRFQCLSNCEMCWFFMFEHPHVYLSYSIVKLTIELYCIIALGKKGLFLIHILPNSYEPAHEIFDCYCIFKQRRLRQASTYARQTLRCLYSQSMDVDEDSEHNFDL